MGIPLYKQIYQQMKHLIRSGEYEVGEFLPPEGELEKQYNVSRTTIRKVVDILVSEGYLEVKQGRGTRVLDFHSTQKLNKVTSISQTLRQKGIKVETKSIYIDIVKSSKETAIKLNIVEDIDIYRVQRVILADGVPIAIMENYIECSLVPNLEYKYKEVESLYRFFEEEYGHHINFAKDIISAKSSDFSESQILDIRAGASLLTLRRISYSNGKPLSYDKIRIRADKYQFEIETSG